MAKAVAKKNLVHVRTPTSKQIELGTGDQSAPRFQRSHIRRIIRRRMHGPMQ